MSETEADASQEPSWESLGLSMQTLELLAKEKFLSPTPIQVQAIPIAIKGRDLVASAKTGSGKTAAFSLPMIEQARGKGGTIGLVLCPTREIALQTQDTLLKFAKPQGVTSAVVIGGANIRQEEKALREYPQIIVGTPGRICDHLERGNIWLEYIRIVALDEADRMLDMGFSNQLNQIMGRLPDERQTMMFSATIAGEAERLSRKFLRDPERLTLGSSLKVADTISQELLWVNRRSKTRELFHILGAEKGPVLIFSRTKTGARDLWQSIHARGFHESGYLSSDKLQKHREQVLANFREGKIQILIATDVAGRGIHVEDVAHVINYDFPLEAEDYIHRVGRTGRKEKSGRATTFVTPQDSRLLVRLEKVIKMTIPERRARDYRMENIGPARGRGGRGGSSRGRPGGRPSGGRGAKRGRSLGGARRKGR